MEFWQQLVMALVSGGGLAAVIVYLGNRRKNKSDVEKAEADITQGNIDAAIKLRDEAIKSYKTTEEKLQEAKRLLSEVEAENRLRRAYTVVICDLLDRNEIQYERWDSFANRHKKEVAYEA